MKKSLLALLAFTSMSAFAESPFRNYKFCVESVEGNPGLSYYSFAKAEGGRTTYVKVDRTVKTLTVPGTTTGTGSYPIPVGANGSAINTVISLSQLDGQNTATLTIGNTTKLKVELQVIARTLEVKPAGTVLPVACGQL